MTVEHLEYIIRSRIRDYENDLKCCEEANKNLEKPANIERIRQDRVIIQELEKILTGENLLVLSYI